MGIDDLGYYLLVVDSGSLADTISLHLNPDSSEIELLKAQSAQEALELLEGNPLDAVVCCNDLGTSSMQGIDLLEWIRNSGSRIPFILAIQETGNDLAIRALNLGAELYLRRDIEETNDVTSELVYYLLERMKSKREEDTVIESEAQFRNLFESSLDGILATDMKGIIVQYNNSFASLIGFNLEELIGNGFECVVPRELLQTAQQVGLEVQKNGQSELVEFELLRSDHTRIPVLLSAWRRENADGIAIGAWIWIRDMTEQKSATEGLLRSEARFHHIFYNSPIAIIISDKQGTIQELNDQCLTMFGLESMESVIGYSIFSDPAFRESVKESLARGERIQFLVNYSFDIVKKNRRYLTSRSGSTQIRVFAGPLYSGDSSQIDGFIFQIIEMNNP